FGSVARQAFDLQPGRLRGEKALHAATLVRAQPIPDKHDPTAAEVAFQIAQEADEAQVGVGARPGLKVEPAPPAIPPKGQRGGDRQAFPVRPRVLQDRGLPARCPRAPDDGLLRHAAFVLADYPRMPAPGVFFTCGQRWRRHWRMAASSRSRAWRAGRCSDHFNPCRMRQTCAGWYCTPVRRAITAAIRGKVHRAVAKPGTAGPFSSAASTPANCQGVSRGLRPARPAAFSAVRPSRRHAGYQPWGVARATPHYRATSTLGTPPPTNPQAAHD